MNSKVIDYFRFTVCYWRSTKDGKSKILEGFDLGNHPCGVVRLHSVASQANSPGFSYLTFLRVCKSRLGYYVRPVIGPTDLERIEILNLITNAVM